LRSAELAAISKIVAGHKLVAAAVLTVMAALAVFSALIFLYPAQQGWTVIKGVKTVSDGRVSTTIDNYSYVTGAQLGPGWGGGEAIFLLTKVTIVNVGNGNASVGSFYVNDMMGQVNVGNAYTIGSSTLPGRFPFSLSKFYGGLNLAPHEAATGWIAFFLPNVSESNIPSLNFVSLNYYEQSYGGNYVGNGGYLPPTEDLRIEFVITP
jgi:hypothetical protein